MYWWRPSCKCISCSICLIICSTCMAWHFTIISCCSFCLFFTISIHKLPCDCVISQCFIVYCRIRLISCYCIWSWCPSCKCISCSICLIICSTCMRRYCSIIYRDSLRLITSISIFIIPCYWITSQCLIIYCSIRFISIYSWCSCYFIIILIIPSIKCISCLISCSSTWIWWK